MRFTDKIICQINKTIGLVSLIISLVIIYLIFERFLDQGFFDGKTHGTIYEYDVKLKDWLSVFILSCSMTLIGINLFYRKRLAYYLFYIFGSGLLLDRLIISISASELKYFVEIIIPILYVLALSVYFNLNSVRKHFGFSFNIFLLAASLIIGSLIAVLPRLFSTI